MNIFNISSFSKAPFKVKHILPDESLQFLNDPYMQKKPIMPNYNKVNIYISRILYKSFVVNLPKKTLLR